MMKGYVYIHIDMCVHVGVYIGVYAKYAYTEIHFSCVCVGEDGRVLGCDVFSR